MWFVIKIASAPSKVHVEPLHLFYCPENDYVFDKLPKNMFRQHALMVI